MRIAINTRFLLPDKLEGLGWFTLEVVRRLVRMHPDFNFLFIFDRPYDPALRLAPNVEAIVVPPPARHPILWYWWFQRSLPRVFRRWRPDVFLSPDGHLSLDETVPALLVVHDIAHMHFPRHIPWMVRRYYDYYTPRFLARADHLITVSEYSRQDIITHYDIEPGKITVCGNGLREGFGPLTENEREAVRRQYSGGHPYFFYLGAIHPRKNVHRLIQAFDRFKETTDSPVKLLVGGALGWQTTAVRKTLAAARHRDDIQLLGYLPEADLPRLLGGALALTYVSLFEGFGVPLLEAMQAEVPILAANRSALPEVAGDAALLVDPTSVEAISQGMEQLYLQPALRHQLIKAGRSRRAAYSWEKTTAIIDTWITKIANQKSGR